LQRTSHGTETFIPPHFFLSKADFMSELKRLFLLDGMAILFRGYFALISTPLSSKSGEPTGGTFAFASALVRLLDQHRPDLIAVAWDSPHPTFRHEQYAEYKANRAAFPDDLVPQLGRAKQIVDLYGIPCLEMPGFEADDIIGTMAHRAKLEGYDVICVTPDKDFFQLVDQQVTIYRPSKPSAPEEIIDIEGVRRKFGVDPEHVIDVLALIGDSSDNVPGVKGVGEKTAIPLIQKYGTIENLYEHIEEIEKAGVKKKLIEGRDAAIMSKELVTIHLEVPVDVTFEQLHLEHADYNGLIALYHELGFKSLVTRYRDRAAAEGITVEIPAGASLPPTAAGRPSPPHPAEEGTNGAAGIEADNSSDEASGGETLNDYSTNGTIDPDFHTGPMKTIADVPHNYRTVATTDDLATLVTSLRTGAILSFDLETDGLDWQTASIIGVALAVTPGEAYYVPVRNDEVEEEGDGTLFNIGSHRKATDGLPLETVLGQLGPLLSDPSIKKVGQNAKFDMLILLNNGVRVEGVDFDTMLASYVLDSTQEHNMDELSRRYLGYDPVSITELIGARGKGQLTMRDVPLDIVSEYAAEDADVTLKLHDVLLKRLQEDGIEDVARRFEFPLVTVLTDMEYCGIKIDVPSLKEISHDLETVGAQLEEEIYELAGTHFNIGSTKQLAEILFERLKLPTKKKTKTGYSTDQFVMEELAALHPLPEKILEFRQAAKLKSTYVDALPDLINPSTGRIHTSYNQAVASTGRLSSNNPNLQNIPIRSEIGREIRKAFIPGIPNGKLLSADYSQIELRIMAHVCGDATLVKAFQEGFDIHTATAMNVFNVTIDEVEPNMRRKAKEVNFGIMYGIGPFGLARRLKIPQSEAKELISTYFAKYPGVQTYIDETIEMVRTKGYVETLNGRRRYYREAHAANHSRRGAVERAAVNMPIQGTASDIIKLAMIDIHRELPGAFPRANMLLQVHDELVFEAPEDEITELALFVKEKMEKAFSLGEVPVVAETGVGDNWYEAH
jgi:DNA polymerase-1